MLVTVKVTAVDIEDGNPNHTYDCPIYRALERIIHKACDISVGMSNIMINNYFTWSFDNQIPPQLNVNHPDFQNDFFLTKNGLKPFSFKVDIPEKYLKDDYLADTLKNAQDAPFMLFFKQENGDYIISDKSKEMALKLTVSQIEKLYNLSRPKEETWEVL